MKLTDADGHKGCPTFVSKGGLDVFKRLLEGRDKYSEDGILTLLSCIRLIASHYSLRNQCIEAEIIPVMLNAMKTNPSPRVWIYYIHRKSNLLYNFENS